MERNTHSNNQWDYECSHLLGGNWLLQPFNRTRQSQKYLYLKTSKVILQNSIRDMFSFLKKN